MGEALLILKAAILHSEDECLIFSEQDAVAGLNRDVKIHAITDEPGQIMYIVTLEEKP